LIPRTSCGIGERIGGGVKGGFVGGKIMLDATKNY
jgi:hypothetical protein